jgi:hypothetical protein
MKRRDWPKTIVSWVAAFFILIALGWSAAEAADVNWTGATSNDWLDSTNWSGGTPTGNIVYINAPANQPVVLSGTDTVTSIQMGYGSNPASLNILPGASLTTTGPSSRLGNGGTGLITQTGGSVVFGQHLSIVDNGPGSGTYDLQGGSVSVNFGYLTIGMRGPGFFNVSGSATLTVNTSFNVGSSHVPTGGSGTVNQSGGTVTASGGVFMGARSGTTGTYNLSGTGVFNINNTALYLGAGINAPTEGGTGTFNQNGGTVNANAGLNLAGNVATSNAAYNLNSGTLNVTGNVADGPGTSTLNIDGGTLNLNSAAASLAVDSLRLGNASGKTGSFTLATGRTLTAANLVLGNQGAGTLTQNGGTANVTSLVLGSQSGSVGAYVLNGGTLNLASNLTATPGTGVLQLDGGTLNLTGGANAITANKIYLGYSNTASWTLTNGMSVTVDGTSDPYTGLQIGNSAGSKGTLNIQPGATLTVAGWSRVGSGGTGTVNQTGGDVRFNGGFSLGDGSGAGAYTISGGTLRSAQITVAMRATSSLVVSDNALVETDSLFVGSRTPDNYGAIGTVTQNGGTFNAKSSGIMLANNAGATGIYNLNDGTLTATTISLGSGSGTFNFNGGTLHAGTINLSLPQNGGILAPGSSVGTTTINGDYTLNAGRLEIELASASSFDVLNVNGNVNLAGGSLDLLLGYAPRVGDSYTILANDGADPINGTFAGLPEGGAVLASFGGALYPFQITYQGGTGNDIALVGVPEPGALLLLIAGVLGWLCATRVSVCMRMGR